MNMAYRAAWSRLGQHRWLAGVAVLVAVVGVQQTYSSVSRRPVAESSRTLGQERLAHQADALALGRLHLLAYQPARAARYFQRLETTSPAFPADVLSGYLGLCAELQGDHATARVCYQRAAEADDYFTLTQARLPRVRRVVALAFADEEAPKKGEPRKQVLERIKEAEQRVRTTPSADARILLLSWRFLYAELAVGADKALPGLGLDQFNKGFDELLKLEADIAKSPSLQEAVDKDPKIRARLDTVRTRLPGIAAKFTAAREAEKKRLETLRSIVRHYRGTAQQPGLTGDLARTTTSLLLGDSAGAAKSLDAAGKQIDAISKLVTSAKDVYLFEDENEKALPGEVSPFSQSFQAHLAMMQGYLKYAEAAQAPTAAGADKLLQEADTLAKDALAKDKGNALGWYVRGLAAEAQGVAKMRTNPADPDSYKSAKPLLAEAANALTTASGDLEKLSGAGSKALRSQIRKRIARLESADAYLDEARDLTQAGKVDDAYALLGEGRLRHREASLWVARAEAARRAHLQGRSKVAAEALEELRSARDAKLIADNNSPALLAEGKLNLALADADIVRLDKLDAEAKKKLADRIDRAAGQLRQSLDNAPKDRIERARREGYLALALAYQQMVSPAKDPRRDPEVRKAFALAGSAINEIGGLSEKDIPDSEALTAGELARGHLAVLVLPAYRDEAQKAFSRAIAASAALPYPSKGLGSLGAPFLSELARRPENALVRRTEDLLRQRRVMTGFVDGVMMLTQNEPSAAVGKMEQGLDWLKKPVTVDDPVEEIDLEDRLLAYLALAQVEAGKPGQAVLTILRTLEEDLSEAEAIRRSERLAGHLASPLLTYALGVALEKRAQAYGLGDQPLRAPALAGARAAYARAAKMLAAPAEKAKLAGYLQESNRAVTRLASPREYLDRWRTLRQANRLEQAEETAYAGLTRHPKSTELWRAYLDTRYTRLAASSSADNGDWYRLLDVVNAMAAQAGELRFERAYWEGMVRQQLKQKDRAAKLFADARKLATAPEDQVRAQTRLIDTRLPGTAR